MQTDFIIRGRQLVLPGSVAARSLHIAQGCIQRIAAYEDISTECELLEINEQSLLMPGLVDTHVHVNEPGRTNWEGFATATRAAAAGGVTTIVDMPLN
ncbi:MAG TPA: amidohydrolase family protein, partial [Pyrinomonadaceae bacterium]|nr:amidohydrolase family protein [Pyrinomonadaceae bacterium]